MTQNETIAYRVNHQIKIREVRLIDQDGKQIGVIATDDARKMANEVGLDLVEVSPDARPPVCRILDYGKFKYQLKKKAHKSKSHQSVLKEIKVTPQIDKHDLSYKVEQIRGFLEDGDKVQVSCIFRGRQIMHSEFGRAVLKEIQVLLQELAKVERAPQMDGKSLSMVLTKK